MIKTRIGNHISKPKQEIDIPFEPAKLFKLWKDSYVRFFTSFRKNRNNIIFSFLGVKTMNQEIEIKKSTNPDQGLFAKRLKNLTCTDEYSNDGTQLTVKNQLFLSEVIKRLQDFQQTCSGELSLHSLKIEFFGYDEKNKKHSLKSDTERLYY